MKSIAKAIADRILKSIDKEDSVTAAVIILGVMFANTIAIVMFHSMSYFPKWELISAAVLTEALFIQNAFFMKKKMTFMIALGQKIGCFLLGWNAVLIGSGLYHVFKALGIERLMWLLQGAGIIIAIIAGIAAAIWINLMIGRAIQKARK